MSRTIESPEEFEESLQMRRIFWRHVTFLCVGLISVLAFLFLLLDQPAPPTVFDPGVIASRVVSLITPYQLQVVSTTLLLFGGIFLFVWGGWYYDSRNAIGQLFRLCRVKQYRRKRGQIVFLRDLDLAVEWKGKGLFEISRERISLALANPSELYWKLLYLQHILLKTAAEGETINSLQSKVEIGPFNNGNRPGH